MPQPDTSLDWIAQLPEVGTPILRQRDDILALQHQMAALQAHLAALQEMVTRRRQALEQTIAARWLPAEIELAQRHSRL